MAVLASFQPKWCELIAVGKKKTEVRRTRPKRLTPFKVYIYQTSRHWVYRLLKKLGLWQGKVIGEFVCDSIRKGRGDNVIAAYYHNNPQETCLTDQEIVLYATYGKPLYFWHISDLKIYDKPKDLSEFGKACCPQSWCYVEEI